MQALKALVIIMGVLIVVGTTVVVVTIYNRMNRPGEGVVGGGDAAPSAAMPAVAPPLAAPSEFAPATVAVPDGCRVIEMVPAGERLLLRLGSISRCSRILVLDLNSGRLLGSIELVPQE